MGYVFIIIEVRTLTSYRFKSRTLIVLSLGWFYVLTALLTAVSFVQYVFVGARMLREPRTY